MRKIRSWQPILLIVFLLFSSCFPALASNTETKTYFSDIQEHWALESIDKWADRGLTQGYPDGTFQPGKSVTRAEFMTWANKAFGYTQTAPLNFTDVSKKDWFALEVAKALAVGYISGYPDGTVKPNNSLSRQEVAVILANILEPQDTVANLAGKFTDNADIPAWSRSAINAIVNSGYMKGYPDGTFKPAQPMTRAEALTVLDNAVGVLYDKAGTYGEDKVTTITGNVTISTSGITLQNTIIDGNLYLTEGIGTGNATLKNVRVKGATKVAGGGDNSIIIIDSDLGSITVNVPDNHRVRLVAEGTTSIGTTNIKTPAIIEEGELTGTGFNDVILQVAPGATVRLLGDFRDVNVETPEVQLDIQKGTVQNLTLAPATQGTTINLASDANIETFTTHSAANVTGDGTIQTANINAAGVILEKEPAKANVAEGVQATIAGEIVEGAEVFEPPATPDKPDEDEEDKPRRVRVSAISVEPDVMFLELDGTATITATVLPMNASNKRVTWSSSDEEVATVDDDGLVTAVNTGSATITATSVADDTKTAICKVTVAWDGEMIVEPEIEDGAYIVNNANEFAWFMGRNVNGETIKLNNNIDLGGEPWTPLANSNNFTIDGNGHIIRNFTLTTGSQDGVGMFGSKGIQGATIKNLVIEDATVTGTGTYYTGILVGDFQNGSVENVVVKNVTVSGAKYVGAVVGQTMNSDLKNITVENAAIHASIDKAGGVSGNWRFEAGMEPGTAENLRVLNSNITSNIKQAGGIFGNIDSRVTDIEMIDCVSENNAIGSNEESTACLVGDIYIGGGYPEGIILIINNPVASGNTKAEGFTYGPGEILVGSSEERWEIKLRIDAPWYASSETSFTISTAEELAQLAMLVNNGNDFAGKTVTLGDNIDLLGIEWTPIGNKDRHPFSGTFDGDGKTISNLELDSDDTSGYYGMFGYLSGGAIKDIDFVGANAVKGGFRLGVLCGYADSATTIDGITVDGTSEVSNTRHAAGICGELHGSIKNCMNTATVSSDYEWGAAAGIVAWLEGTAEDCTNTGSITSWQKNGAAGGIAGYLVDGNITDCFNSGPINVGKDVTHAYAGGIAAYTEGEATITDCTNRGDVDASDEESNTAAFKRCAGGIVGYHNTGTLIILRSINIGAVTGYNYAAGMIGHIVSTGYCDVKCCYNSGTIRSEYAKNAESPSYASGVVGYTGNYKWDQQTVEYCLNVGDVENYGTPGEALQVAKEPTDSYYYIGELVYDASTNELYEGTPEALASLLNEGLGSEFWGVEDGAVKPLS